MHRLRWILIANSEIRLFRRRRKRNSLTKREKEGRRRKKGRDSGFLYVQEREAQREEVARGRKVFDTISEFMSAIHLFEDEDALDDEESLSENSGDRGYWTEMVTKAVGLYTFQACRRLQTRPQTRLDMEWNNSIEDDNFGDDTPRLRVDHCPQH
jgi:hypothetical protein